MTRPFGRVHGTNTVGRSLAPCCQTRSTLASGADSMSSTTRCMAACRRSAATRYSATRTAGPNARSRRDVDTIEPPRTPVPGLNEPSPLKGHTTKLQGPIPIVGRLNRTYVGTKYKPTTSRRSVQCGLRAVIGDRPAIQSRLLPRRPVDPVSTGGASVRDNLRRRNDAPNKPRNSDRQSHNLKRGYESE